MRSTTDVQLAEATSRSGGDIRLAMVLWNGKIGGAEILTATLAEHILRLNAHVTIVFVAYPEPLSDRLERAGIPYCSLELKRGRDVLRHPRLYARELQRQGPDGALVVERGFLGAALRLGGYPGPIVAVEHGTLLIDQHRHSAVRRLRRRISRRVGARAVDAEVAVSDCMFDRMSQHPHARHIRRIYNGIDPDISVPATKAESRRDQDLVIGFAGRLIAGKGADHLIRAAAELEQARPIRILIA